MKKLVSYTEKEPRLRLEIQEDTSAGYYLVVYPENSDKSSADYLQDTLASVLKFAEETYGIPKSSWKEE